MDTSVAASLTPGKWDCWARLLAISMTASTTSTSHLPVREQNRGLSWDGLESFVATTTSSGRAAVLADASSTTSSGRAAVGDTSAVSLSGRATAVSGTLLSSSSSPLPFLALCLLHKHITAETVASATTMKDAPKSTEGREDGDPGATNTGAKEGVDSKVLRPEVDGAGDVGPRDAGDGEPRPRTVGAGVGAETTESVPGVDVRRGPRPEVVGSREDDPCNAGAGDTRPGSSATAAGAVVTERGPGVDVRKGSRPEVVGGEDVGPRDVGTGDTIFGNVGIKVEAGAMEAGPGVDTLRGSRPVENGAGEDGAGDTVGRDVCTAPAGEREEGPRVGFRVVPNPVGIGAEGEVSTLESGSGVGEGGRRVSVSSIKAAKSSTPAFSSSQDPDVHPARTTDSLGPAATASK